MGGRRVPSLRMQVPHFEAPTPLSGKEDLILSNLESCQELVHAVHLSDTGLQYQTSPSAFLKN